MRREEYTPRLYAYKNIAAAGAYVDKEYRKGFEVVGLA